jgi:proteic killer suppression protein
MGKGYKLDIFEVVVARQVIKDLKKLPSYVVLKLQAWIDDISHRGLREVRKIPGYHDEPLKGKRQGQRSIRLSKQYRAIYVVDEASKVHFIEVIEVNKHEY